MTENISKINK